MASIFNNPNPFTKSQPAQTSSLFGQPQNQAQTGSSMYGAAQPQQSLFGKTQQSIGLFGQTQSAVQPASNTFGAKQPEQQQTRSLFGGFGGNTAQQPQQQHQQQQSTFPPEGPPRLTQSLWKPGAGLNSLNRGIGEQIELISNKWRPDTPDTAFQTYLYNYVGEAEAPFYAPRPGEDVNKWEEALQKRPGPGYIPALAKGFSELGARLKRQNDYLTIMRSRLHEINDSLTAMLQKHDLVISIRAAECRRKHLVLSQRCLALATKAAVLKNRGFGMDSLEEELKLKLDKLEREVFDPSLYGRAEEIWARMLAIRERSKTLLAQMERYGQAPTKAGGPEIDEAAIKFAKSQLETYSEQLQHLNKELAIIKTDFEEWESAQIEGQFNGTSRAR